MDFLIQSYDASDNDRMNILAKAETELLQGAACLPIYHNFAASVIDIDFIQGWYQNALDIHPYKYLRFGTPSISPNVAKASSSYISLR
jgi:oligopeptide transport system substrate-binding protein